ncbi:MAG: glycoside hydrolase family protein [Planctomycetota bacterium]
MMLPSPVRKVNVRPGDVRREDRWSSRDMTEPIIHRLLPIPRDSGFRLNGHFVWCGSLIRVGDLYHLFASRWPEGAGDPGDPVGILDGYRRHSEIVRATADNPLGPYVFRQLVLAGRGEPYWDGKSCHGPKIVRSGGAFVLYYQGIACGSSLRKIGYARADQIEGPWQRSDREIPLTDDANNPAPCVRPDGSVLLAYRTRELVVNVARADAVDGEYATVAEDVFPDGMLEDPDLYFAGGQYHMIVEDNQGVLTGSVRHGGHLVSADGVRWKPHDSAEAYTHHLEWTDGTSVTATRRERPDMFNDEEGAKGNGEPTHLLTGVLLDGHSRCVVQEIAPA